MSKNFSKITISAFRRVIMAMMVLFLFAALSQQVSAQYNSPNQKPTTGSAVTPKVEATPVVEKVEVTVQATDPTKLPYYQYNGITDLDQAKDAYVKDHPEFSKASAPEVVILPETHFLEMSEGAMITYMQKASIQDIKAFIKEVLAVQLPTDYQLPTEVKIATSSEMAVQAIGLRYPEFYGKQGSDFLQAISQNPVRYIAMIMEYRAVRAMFGANQPANNQ